MSNVNQLFEKASKFYHKGRLQDAEKVYKNIVKMIPASTDALNMCGVIQAQMGNYPKAIGYFSRLLKIEPAHAAALENIARSYLGLGQAEPAHGFFEKALKINPHSYMAHFGSGCALMTLNRFDESLASFKKAQQINPKQALLHLNIGSVLNQMGNLDEAISSYNQALRLDSKLPQAHSQLGHLYLQTNNYELAKSHLQKALDLGVNDMEVELDLAEAFEFNNELDDAYKQYLKVAEKFPDSLNAYTKFDQFLLRSGDSKKRLYLEHIGSDHVYKDWMEAVDDAKILAGMFRYHDQSAKDALDNFLNNYNPGILHDRTWWQKQLDSFGDPTLGHDKLLRSVHSAVFCWSLPDRETLNEIADFIGNTRLYSYGAGTGVWERLLIENFKLNVIATEFKLRHRFLQMSFEDYSKAIVNNDDAIFLSWILRGDTKTLNIFNQIKSGQKLVLVGEPPDEYGIPRICASPEIFSLLESDFTLVKTLPLVSYSLLNDTVSLYIRN